MLLAPLLVAAVLAGPPARGTRLEQAQRAFVSGDYDGALKLLEPLQDAADVGTQEKVQLLRAQCFAARQDFARAEEAFTLALEANPETSLDPARVDPSVVRVLDGLRARLSGELLVVATPPAEVSIDGKVVGTAPVSSPQPIGRHKVEVKYGPKSSAEASVVVFVHRPSQVVFSQAAQGEGGKDGQPLVPEPSKVRPFGDLRGVWEPNASDEALELGGGVEFPYTRVGVSARLFPDFFGFTLRAGLVVPVHERISAYLEVEWPFMFRSQVAIGLGGVGGAEFHFSRWLGAFVQLGGKHYFSNPDSNVDNRFVLAGGVRLRLP